MKILLIVTGLGIGGAERQVLDLASAFTAKHHEVRIIYLTGDIGYKEIKTNILIKKIEFKKNLILSFFHLLKEIKKFSPDVVHSHMFHANIIARICRIFTKIPTLISTAHSKNEGGYIRMRAYQLTDHLATISTNVSTDAVLTYENLKATPKGRMLTIYNGIDTKKFIPNLNSRNELRKILNTNNDYVFLFVGRLVSAKDIPTLLKAFKIIRKEKKNSRLIIAGDGPLKSQLITLVKNLNIEDGISFLGARNDIPDLMNIADTFVMSSTIEGFPLVAAEAMLTKNIVVATDAGGTSELMGNIGYISPTKDYHLLADNMKKSMELNDMERDIIKNSARKHIIENFDIQLISEKWLNIYQKYSSK